MMGIHYLQALLKRVLLAYARWNKEVGYCQGLNVLAALLLEVMNRSEVESLKVRISSSMHSLYLFNTVCLVMR